MENIYLAANVGSMHPQIMIHSAIPRIWLHPQRYIKTPRLQNNSLLDRKLYPNDPDDACGVVLQLILPDCASFAMPRVLPLFLLFRSLQAECMILLAFNYPTPIKYNAKRLEVYFFFIGIPRRYSQEYDTC